MQSALEEQSFNSPSSHSLTSKIKKKSWGKKIVQNFGEFLWNMYVCTYQWLQRRRKLVPGMRNILHFLGVLLFKMTFNYWKFVQNCHEFCIYENWHSVFVFPDIPKFKIHSKFSLIWQMNICALHFKICPKCAWIFLQIIIVFLFFLSGHIKIQNS